MMAIMEFLSQIEKGGIFVIAVLSSLVLINYSARVWVLPKGLIFISILGASLGAIVALLYYYIPSSWTLGLSSRALLFIMLYGWCVLGMLFFAARNTHVMKLMLGLVSQAGILYGLFSLV